MLNEGMIICFNLLDVFVDCIQTGELQYSAIGYMILFIKSIEQRYVVF